MLGVIIILLNRYNLKSYIVILLRTRFMHRAGCRIWCTNYFAVEPVSWQLFFLLSILKMAVQSYWFSIQSMNDFYENFVFFKGSSSSDSEVTTSPSDNSSSFVRHNNSCVVRVQYERLYFISGISKLGSSQAHSSGPNVAYS